MSDRFEELLQLLPTRRLTNITHNVIFGDMQSGRSLREGRKRAGWTQDRLAARLGVTQAYLSLMEQGKRRVPDRVARAAATLLDLPPTVLPVREGVDLGSRVTDDWVARQLSRLGYPPLEYLRKPGARKNPAEVLIRALARDDLDPRLVEALPWLLLRFENLDTGTLVLWAKMRDLQNRLGFTVSLARQVAASSVAYRHRLDALRSLELSLEPSRLAREDTFGRSETSRRMRTWLRAHRTREARHWNLLTDLEVEHLPYADDPGAMAELSS